MDVRPHSGGGGTVLVLGGGGARGAAQVGVLRALATRGLVPDACVGTSVGALNAAVCAALPLPEAVAHLERTWALPETRRVLRRRTFDLIRNQALRRPYLQSNEPMRLLLRRALGDIGVHGFEDMRIPLRIVMTDLLAGEPVVAETGDLESALCASAAIPGVYPPVMVGERLCVDGGVIDNCSLATAAVLRADRIVAIDLTGESPHPGLRSIGAVFERMRQVAMHARIESDYDRFSDRLPVTLICPRPSFKLRGPRFEDLVAWREMAREATEKLLTRIGTPDGVLEPGLYYLPLEG